MRERRVAAARNVRSVPATSAASATNGLCDARPVCDAWRRDVCERRVAAAWTGAKLELVRVAGIIRIDVGRRLVWDLGWIVGLRGMHDAGSICRAWRRHMRERRVVAAWTGARLELVRIVGRKRQLPHT